MESDYRIGGEYFYANYDNCFPFGMEIIKVKLMKWEKDGDSKCEVVDEIVDRMSDDIHHHYMTVNYKWLCKTLEEAIKELKYIMGGRMMIKIWFEEKNNV
jgi:hypothetical protein